MWLLRGEQRGEGREKVVPAPESKLNTYRRPSGWILPVDNTGKPANRLEGIEI